MITTLLKSTLVASALLSAGTMSVQAQKADASVSITVGKAAGSFTKQNQAQTWASEWTSTQTAPQLKLSCDKNNMAFYDDANIKLFTNGAAPFRATYTLTASEGWAVQGYSFDFTADAANGQVTVTPEGKAAVNATGLTEKKSVKVELATPQRTASFDVSRNGNKDFARTSNFVVKLVKKAGERQHNLMVTNGTGIPYRIPALAVAGKSGHLTAVGDYRFSRADIGYGHIDLHIARSLDNGETWTQPTDPKDEQGRDVAKGNDGSARNSAFGDAAIVGDHESDEILMLSVSGRVPLFSGRRNNPNPVARWYSHDGGATWTQHEDLTEHIYKLFDGVAPAGYIDSMFFGSGRIFQSSTVKVGTHYRVYAALSGYVKATGVMACWVLYSDDFGKNWKVLGDAATPPVPTGGDEPKVEELPNGSIVISARAHGGRNYNIYTFSNVEKAEGMWAEKAFSSKNNGGITASSNACNGEILILPVKRTSDNQKMFLALQSVPFGPSGRTRVGINYKELASVLDYNTPNNFAKGWDGTKLVTELGSAYSTMVLQKDHHVGFFYEEETFTNTSGGGYTLVYKKYSVEDITGGAYTYDATAPRPTIDAKLATALEVAEARKALALKGLGYAADNAQERAALLSLIEKVESENTVTKDEMAKAIAALYMAKQVELPLNQRYYTLTFVGKDGKEFFLNQKDDALEVKPRQANQKLPLTAMFLAKKQEDGQYMLLAQDGRYLGVKEKKPVLEAASTTPLSFNKLMAGEKVMLESKEAYGFLTLQAQENYWALDVSKSALVLLPVSTLDEAHTTALRLEQAVPPLGATVTKLADVKADKAYALYNAHFTTYVVKKAQENNVWVEGMKGDATHALSMSEYSKDYDAFAATGAWQLAKNKKGEWFLYNIGAKQYAKTGNPSVFSTDKVAIKVREIEGGFAFSTTGGNTDFFCAAPQLAGKPIANWTADDAGSKWVLIENPYVEADMDFFNTITAVEQAPLAQRAVSSGIYNLKGQRLQVKELDQLPAGIYLVDGQKRVVR
ncbi:MAG: sialidase family protein [Bacteroidales bacterium]|nr:sialidase family protein [Bacteroidales bacterium]